MPKMDEILKNRKKKGFQKKTYRAWDLSGEADIDDKNKAEDAFPEISEKKKTNIISKNDVVTINKSPLEKKKVIHNQGTNKGTDQGTNKGTIGYELGYNKGTDQGTNKGTIGYELGYSHSTPKTDKKTVKLDIKNKESVEYLLKTLTGAQAKIFYFLISKCADNNPNNIIITATEIATHCNYSYNTIKISLKRLVDKKIIIRNKGKTSRNGYLNLTLDSHIKNLGNIFLSNKINEVNLGYELGYNQVHSSSSYINTTTKSNKQILPSDWQDIDFEDLKTIGFTVTQLKQLLDKNEPELVQESIYHFAYGLENNQKTKQYAADKKALNVLMGVLRKGQGWAEPGYISPKERAMQEQLERRKAEVTRIKQMEDELFSLEFDVWMGSQDKQTLDDLVPSNAKKHASMRRSALRLHFKENHWGKSD